MNSYLTKALRLLPVGLFVLLGFLIIGLAWYNLPSAADDYCFALNTLKFGFWEGQLLYYKFWTGRYFSTFLSHANPLVLGWLGWYKIFPILLLLALFHATWVLIRHFVHDFWQSIQLTTAFMGFYMLYLPTIAEGFFWYPAVLNYTLPLCSTAWAFAAILQLKDCTPTLMQAIWISFLIFATVGSNETPMLVIFMIIGVIFLQKIWLRQTIGWHWWLWLGVLAGSVYLDLSAAGNTERIKYNPHARQIIFSAIAAINDTLFIQLKQWLFHTPLLVVSLLFLPIAHRISSSKTIALLTIHPIWVLLVWLASLPLGTFLGYYGIGIAPPNRVINLSLYFFLAGWFYVIILFARHLPQKLWNDIQSLGVLFYLLGVCIIGNFVYKNPNLRTLYGDLRHKKAEKYHAQLLARYHTYNQSKHLPVVVDNLSALPQSLFTEDIKTNPKHLWNTCQAEFWQLKSVQLK